MHNKTYNLNCLNKNLSIFVLIFATVYKHFFKKLFVRYTVLLLIIPKFFIDKKTLFWGGGSKQMKNVTLSCFDPF